ncbi:MAG: glycosyltransferase [Acidimicrobiia bacterium]
MGSRPVILVFIKGLGIGGAERLISEAASYWDRERFDYRVAYLLPWKNQLVPELQRQEVEVTMVGGRRGADPLAASRLRQHIAKIGAKLVHAHLPSAGILARLVSPVPVVYTEHNLLSSYRPATRWLNRLTYFRNAATTAVSEAVAVEVLELPGPRVEVVTNGVSVSVARHEIDEVRKELDLSPGEHLVVHVGNIRPHKGHAHLVETARWLADQSKDIQLVSVGGEKYPGDLARIRTLARDRGVEKTIRFLGRREEARAFLAAADLVVNPSDFEGLPVVLLEAMALGRPVVATAVGGVPGLIEDGVTGLLIPPADPPRLGQAILRLTSDPRLAADLGAAGRAVVAERYGLGRMVSAFEDIYERVLSG